MQFVANVGYGAVGTFGSLLIKSLGYSSREALIMTMPDGAVTFFAGIVACYMADRMKDRTSWAGITSVLGCIFGAMLYGLENDKLESLMAFHVSTISTQPFEMSTDQMN
jgi:ACS family allantoate permease-like MFS transporter